MGGADIEDDEFVGAFEVVAGGEFGGVSHVAQAFEFDAFDDATGVDIKTRDDAAGERHWTDSMKFFRTRAPVSPDFSG